ncbi:unnamed protein product, partial [Gordionus sp. m RMFG-2023]
DTVNAMNQMASDIFSSDTSTTLMDGARAEAGEAEAESRRFTEQFESLKRASIERRAQLEEADAVHNFLRDVDHEEAWIEEKLLLLDSDDYGKDMMSVQNLRKKHKRFEMETTNHEANIQSLTELASQIKAECPNYGGSEIDSRLSALESAWERLRTTIGSRGRGLDDSLTFQQFNTDVQEETGWIKESVRLANIEDYGQNMASVQSLLKKHDIFNDVLETHVNRCQAIENIGQELSNEGNMHAQAILEKCRTLKDKMENLSTVIGTRRSRLEENLAFMQFMWKADLTENWITDKETYAKSEDYGHDLSSVVSLLAKHDHFTRSLNCFEDEGALRALNQLETALLADRNITVGSEQERWLADRDEVIRKRYKEVVANWESLVRSAKARSDRLREAQERYKKIEELYLTFAKKASAFNSWYENAEEDLTDPVRCNSVEEIKLLKESHANFKEHLSVAREEFDELVELDRLIKSFRVGPNPYTWFTIEALTDTWNNLLAIIEERQLALDKEETRQIENDKLRRQYAHHANAFHTWLVERRTAMMESAGTLEEQLETIKHNAHLVKEYKSHLRQIEELGALLEQNLIFDNRYTEHSTLSLAQEWDQLDHLGMRLQHNLEQQIQARNTCGVSEETLREFGMMFKHFDKDKSGKLDHKEFKSCLRALGYDLPMVEEGEYDSEFDSILNAVDPNRDGYVSLQEYMAFMIAKESENVSSNDEIIEAFKALTSENKPYILADEIRSNLRPDEAEFCLKNMNIYVDPKSGREIRGAVDYIDFTQKLFQI